MAGTHTLIHQAPEREGFYRDVAPARWSEELGAWAVIDRALVLSLLKDKGMAAIDFKTETEKLAEHFGVDFSASVSFLDYVPLGLEGPKHASVRKEMALGINKKAADSVKAFEAVLAEKLRPLFAKPRTFNIVEELFNPAISALSTALSGVTVEKKNGVAAPQIFDRALSLNRRRQVDRQIGDLVAQNCPHMAADSAALHVAMVVIGSDSILGSFSASYAHEIDKNPGKRMSEIAWSEKIPVSGVPYVDRIAAKSFDIPGGTIESGQRVRLYLDQFLFADNSERDSYFGAGRHVCLGKAISVQAWRSLVAAFSAIDARVKVKDVRYRKPDYLFNFPEVVEIEVFR